ncbi:MAG: hypothetical protein KDE27_05955, partial [Planctomycetes bacterium]|nr:hypothetical protein [Planctomycetota bacterium]
TAGEVLAAHAAATAGLDDPPFRRELERALTDAGAAGDPTASPTADPSVWPLPERLPRERAVRVRLASGAAEGAIVDAGAERVTVRVRSDRGLTFPTVELTACEPIDPTAAEAAELGFAALHAGDPLLARLWLACAQSRIPPSGSQRAARLRELLP